MILSVYAYGQGVLKKVGQEITPDYPNLDKLITDMWETLYYARGVGLAAPQIGKSIRLFLVDTIQLEEEEEAENEQKGIKQVFINPVIIEESGEEWAYEEGCLSIPDIRGEVMRAPKVHIKWVDQYFNEHEATFDGMNARVIQHEYDHIEGILFTELLKPIKRKLIRRKLENIKKGKTKAEYKMKFI